MIAKHTPGPWATVAGHSLIYIQAGTKPVATTYPENYWTKFSDTDSANARLIAAAPDLLAALKAIIKSLSDQDDEGMIEHAPQMQAARAAIAKATAIA